MHALVQDLPVQVEHLQYNNFIGVLGSFYFSKIRKVNYQRDDTSRKQFIGLYRYFSESVVPMVRAFGRIVPVPLGLNLTLVLRKR
jgi:hypothetical protein